MGERVEGRWVVGTPGGGWIGDVQKSAAGGPLAWWSGLERWKKSCMLQGATQSEGTRSLFTGHSTCQPRPTISSLGTLRSPYHTCSPTSHITFTKIGHSRRLIGADIWKGKNPSHSHKRRRTCTHTQSAYTRKPRSSVMGRHLESSHRSISPRPCGNHRSRDAAAGLTDCMGKMRRHLHI